MDTYVCETCKFTLFIDCPSYNGNTPKMMVLLAQWSAYHQGEM
jgi:hypothetical protein